MYLTNFAGFTCMTDPSDYNDDKFLIRFVALAIFSAAAYFIIQGFERNWVRVILIILLAIICLIGWIFMELWFIPWGC